MKPECSPLVSEEFNQNIRADCKFLTLMKKIPQ